MNRKGSNLEERKVQTTRSGQGDSPVTRIGKTSIKRIQGTGAWISDSYKRSSCKKSNTEMKADD